jgi:hypothetical protein
MSIILNSAKVFIFIGVGLAFIPIFLTIYFLRDRIEDPSGLITRLFFVFIALIVVWMIIKVIKKLIHTEEEESDLDTRNLLNLSLFGGLTGKLIFSALGLIVAILLISLTPSPWNLFLILFGFYVLFSMMIRAA